MSAQDDIGRAYEEAGSRCTGDPRSEAARQSLLDLVTLSLRFLGAECRQETLTSRVPGKEYSAYSRASDPRTLSRPANRALFVADVDEVREKWDECLDGALDADEAARLIYSVALAPCLCMELFDRQNKKGPATYFEWLVGHIVATKLGANPAKRARLVVGGKTIGLTMDFLFTLANGARYHVPVKMSTRERVVQAWAHQRLLDSAYGVGAYRGLMVLFAETKLDSRKREVVEICVPDQWLVYQAHLASIESIYYFDMPERYRTLAREYPNLVQIKSFADFLGARGNTL